MTTNILTVDTLRTIVDEKLAPLKAEIAELTLFIDNRELKHPTFLTTRTAEKPRKTGSRPSFLARNRKVKQSTFLRHGLLPVLTCLR